MKKFKTNGRIFLSHDKTNPRPRQSYSIKSEKGFYPVRRKMCDPPGFCFTAKLGRIGLNFNFDYNLVAGKAHERRKKNKRLYP